MRSGFSLKYCFQYVAAVIVFSLSVSVVLFPVCSSFCFWPSVVLFIEASKCVFFSCHQMISHDRIYVEQKERNGGQILKRSVTHSIDRFYERE